MERKMMKLSMSYSKESNTDMWHLSIDTYPSQADTYCGKKLMPATEFKWFLLDKDSCIELDGKLCKKCLEKWKEENEH